MLFYSTFIIQEENRPLNANVFYFWLPYFIYMERKILQGLASLFFFFSFQTHFASLKFVYFKWHALCVFWLWSVTSQTVLAGALQFPKNLYRNVAIDHVPKLASQIFRREVFGENELKTPKTYQANRRTWLAIARCAYDGCLCYWHRYDINYCWRPTKQKYFRILLDGVSA